MRAEIVEQRLRPRSRLGEAALAARFGVSRTVVRAALERLGGEGLVERASNRSARVATVALETAADLLDVREGLEAMVVSGSPAGWTRTGSSGCGTTWRSSATPARSTGRRPWRLAGEFHVLLAELTGSDALRRFVSDIVSRSSLIPTAHDRPHSTNCAVREHEDIVRLLRDCAAAACACRRSHLSTVAARARIRPSPAD